MKQQLQETRNVLARGLLVVVGTLFVGLGVAGVFLPLLPTTPFLLLAAACYVRGSQRLYNWLLSNAWTGEYVRNYREGRGMPPRAKLLSILLLWATLGISAWLVPAGAVRLLLLLVAVGVPLLIVSLPTLKEQ